MSADSTRVFRLEGKLQHYDWGGIRFLPELLGISNPEQRPFAEYWLGAHDQSSAEILLNDGKKTRLDDYIRLAPAERLGPAVYQQFGRLPYLLKLLDVRKMLSIQVHPSKKDAEKEADVA